MSFSFFFFYSSLPIFFSFFLQFPLRILHTSMYSLSWQPHIHLQSTHQHCSYVPHPHQSKLPHHHIFALSFFLLLIICNVIFLSSFHGILGETRLMILAVMAKEIMRDLFLYLINQSSFLFHFFVFFSYSFLSILNCFTAILRSIYEFLLTQMAISSSNKNNGKF